MTSSGMPSQYGLDRHGIENVNLDSNGPDNEGVAEIILAKQRNGPTGNVKLAFVSEHTRFENLARVPA